MTTTKAFIASLSLLFSSFNYTMDIIEHQPNKPQKDALTALMFKGALQAPQSLKKRNPLLLHHDGKFHIIQKGKLSKIPSDRITGLPKDLTTEQFQGFLEHGGYLWIDKDSNDDYCVEAKVRGLGGGYFTAQAVYLATKSALIAAAVTGTAAAVCTAGGALAAGGSAIAAGTAGTGATIATGAGAFVTEVAVGGSIATGAGGAIAAAAVVGGTDAAIATTAILTSTSVGVAAAESAGVAIAGTGMAASIAAAIEAASIAAAAPFIGPWCP